MAAAEVISRNNKERAVPENKEIAEKNEDAKEKEEGQADDAQGKDEED